MTSAMPSSQLALPRLSSATKLAARSTTTVPSLDNITHLITTLREHAQAFPAENKDEALDVLKDLERDIQDPEPDPNRIGRRLKRLAAIATTVGALTGGAATFSGDLNTFTGNVLELTETFGIPLEQVQPSQSP